MTRQKLGTRTRVEAQLSLKGEHFRIFCFLSFGVFLLLSGTFVKSFEARTIDEKELCRGSSHFKKFTED
jgi:hypothetical protein